MLAFWHAFCLHEWWSKQDPYGIHERPFPISFPYSAGPQLALVFTLLIKAWVRVLHR